jgi:hypothetical protein
MESNVTISSSTLYSYPKLITVDTYNEVNDFKNYSVNLNEDGTLYTAEIVHTYISRCDEI